MFFVPAKRVEGEYTPPADKSVSHRAAIIAAMCTGRVEVGNYLDSDDTNSTLKAVTQLGAAVDLRGEGELKIEGVGLQGTVVPEGKIDVGNAGTLMRLLPGWLAAQEGRSFTLDGDASIRRRPVGRIAEPLAAMGARIETESGTPPVRIEGEQLHGISYKLPVASAQVKSCLLLAGLNAEGETTIVEKDPSRDHTERMLRRAGVPVRSEGSKITVGKVESIGIDRIDVPNDFSSAAFMAATAALLPGSSLLIKNVGVNWTRTGLLQVVERMGARIEGDVENRESATPEGEPIEDLHFGHGELAATAVGAAEIPLLIDELPLVALLGCFADGQTEVTGAQELRHKESDRIETVVTGLRGLGAEIEALPDGFVVSGTGGLRGGTIDSHGDHRIAMMGAIAGLASKNGVEVSGFEAASVSYPRFADDLAAVVVS